MMESGPSRSRHAVRAIWLLGLAAAFLSPALKTGYWSEDLYQSLHPHASRVLNGITYGGVVLEHIKVTLLAGRFFPLTAVLISAVHTIIREAWQYKAFILIASLLDLYLFFLLVQKLTRRRDYACFAACVTVGLIQYRLAVDPSLGFFGQMQLLIAALFLSLLALQSYLESQGRAWWWMAASVALYAACALLYEVSYVLVLLHFCLIGRASSDLRGAARVALPFLGVVGFCAFQTVLIRWLHPADAYWHRTDFGPGAVLRAVAYQTSAGLPLSYLLADPLEIFPGGGRGALLPWLLHAEFALLALPAFGLCYLCLRTRESAGPDPAVRGLGWGWLMAMGAILAVVPSFLIAISPYHREKIGPGVGWIPVLIQAYGVGLLISGGLWGFASAQSGGGTRWKCVAAALLVALLVGTTFRANAEVARCFVAERRTERFRGEFGVAGGGFQNERLLLEAAFDAGLMDDVPEDSKVELNSEYPFWYDATYSRIFYAAHTGKAFRTENLGFHHGDLAAHAYRVRDVPRWGPGYGFVLLAHRPGEGKAEGRGLRLFVRHPSLSRDVAATDFRVRSKVEGRDRSASEFEGDDLPVLRSGRDWTLFSLAPVGTAIKADAIQVVLDRRRSATAADAIARGDGGAIRR